jgi:hypothetical protein
MSLGYSLEVLERMANSGDLFRFSNDVWTEMEDIVKRAGGDLDAARTNKEMLEIQVHAGLVLHRTGYNTVQEWKASAAKLKAMIRHCRQLDKLLDALRKEQEHGVPSTGSWLDASRFTRDADSVLRLRSTAEAMLKAKASDRANGKEGRDFILRQFGFFWRDALGLKIGTHRLEIPAKNGRSSRGNHALAFTLAGCRAILPASERSPDAVLGVLRKGIPNEAQTYFSRGG